MKIFPRFLFRSCSFLLAVGYTALSLLNPEIFPALLHESVFHKKGAVINHAHTSVSFHTIFKHSAATARGTFFKNTTTPFIVNDLLSTTCNKAVKIFALAAFAYFLLFKILFVQKNGKTLFLNPSARSPPVF